MNNVISGQCEDVISGALLSSLSGSYVHIEASRPAKKGFRARLVSRVISLKVSCLRFFYHMHGNNAHIGELSMRVKTLAPGAEDKAVWALDEKQGEDWVSKSIMLVSTVPFLVRGRSQELI